MQAPDLRALDFDAFVALVFDHPAYEGQEVEQHADGSVSFLEQPPPEWYWEVEWSWDELPADPLHTLALMTELFERAHELPGRFGARQIRQGFNLLLHGAAGAFIDLVWDERLPREPREALLRAVVPLYRWLFDVHTDIEYIPFMFWDVVLGYRLDPGADELYAPPDDPRLQATIVDVIREMLLVLDGPWSAPAALHGAHHAHHPDALDAVREWLERAPPPAPGEDEDHWVQYARKVLVGEAM
jgi:hypothetical protein